MSFLLLVVLLMVVGVVMLTIEVLVIPGFGVVGVLGILSIVAGCIVAWSTLGAGYGILAIGSGAVASVLLFWLLPKTPTGKALVLRQVQQSGRAAGPLTQLVGKEGKTLTPLRPAGSIEVDNRTVDVVTDGVYVEAGAAVRVVKVEGSRVVVEPLSA